MKFLFLKKINKKAFSLIELSIVIVIISILLSGALSIVTSTTNSSKIKATNNNINEVYNAIKVYLLTNNRLPCPAPITAIKSTSDSYGTTTGTAGNCSVAGVYTSNEHANLVYGMVPVKDLGLSADMAEDAFGNKLAYIVNKRFTAGGIADNTFGGDNAGLITIKETTSAMVGGAEVNQTNTSSAIFVIISYGSNKLGAFGINSATQNAESADEGESSNYAVPVTATTASLQDTFYSHAGNSDVFDDIVLYRTRDMLVTEAGAFNLIPCPALSGTSSGVSYVGDNGVTSYMTWSKATYGQIAAADTNCPSGYLQTVAKPTKKCNALGNWQVGVIDPCTYTATAAASALGCTGGTSTTSGSKTVHTFTTVGVSSLVCTGSGTLTYLVVGGGGGDFAPLSGCFLLLAA